MTWLTRAVLASASLHERWFRTLSLPHLHRDELRTRLRDRAHVLWRWGVVDPLTQRIPVLHLVRGPTPPRMLWSISCVSASRSAICLSSRATA